ncbi:MAG: EamA family transporter [Verrucomicrobiota bacterium]
MSWLVLTIASAFLLGFYDYFKKLALRDNAVLPVLFGSVAAGALVWLPFVLWSAVAPATLPAAWCLVAGMSAHSHLLLLAKAAIVGASWLCGYFGIKSLPLSIASPIRATGPLWTIAFAVLLFHESPAPRQWLGVAVILASFFAFTFVGRREGIHFHRNRAVWFMAGATLLGAASSLYDKFLLQGAHLSPVQVQAWFTIYTTLLLVPPLVLWLRLRHRHPFHWHWAIPVIGFTLLAADILYFTAIAQPGALISLISPARRTSVVVSFLLGIFLFQESHLRSKAACVAGIITGVILLS